MTTPPTTNSSDGSGEKRTELVVCQFSPKPHPLDDECQRVTRCPAPDEYGRCVCCGHRYGVFCTCNTTFAERARSVSIDAEALRRFHGR